MATEVNRHTLVLDTDTSLSVQDFDNGFIVVLTNTAAVTITLPPVILSNDSIRGTIKRIGSNDLTIEPYGGAPLIDGAASEVIVSDYSSEDFTYVNDGDSYEAWNLS